MAILRPALLLGLFLGAAPALAQGPAPGMNPGTNPGSAASPATAGSQVSGRRTTATGQTKPPGGTAATGLPQPVNQAEMIKAQKAAEARSKAWDSKMRHTMGSICQGC
ncbi:MAG: hypothetical protein CL858_29340 [Cupriavidus sp.]|jgi:hypothetical protein|uniref:Uncharacterized protein n=3 Tax=Methylobacterium TaxID=407 RepID=A0AAE8HMR8_9HYPH|nr:MULTISPECIES: hypothetical protein [Methylobacterium]MBU69485.1 hypothetical protein [Cupriavidus sp.]AIQ89899.1 protein of unassigned function [Methylobacterium oryzae CBMB20]APT30662.1 hypothetical protein MCBMB27_01371 [Methylobacterium phyllosphaerae]MBA9063377.1 hypothetical protein [Methylobacterium fujisawaense]MBP32482.1 hypothetical protein [Methylobacterium sp.]